MVIEFSGSSLILGVFGDIHRYLSTCPVWHLGCCSDSMVGAVTKEKKTDYKERELGPEEKLPRVRKS